MNTNNKYGSRIETFIADAMLNIQLDSEATPPADLALAQADFTAQDMYALSAAGLRRGNFEINDVPRLLGVGVWCNLADGLVQIDNPDAVLTGLVLRFQWQSYNAGGVLQQANIFTPSIDVKVTEFNQIFDVDALFNASGLQANLIGDANAFTRINASWLATTSAFSTISVDPAYATKRLIIRPMVVVEHTFAMKTAGF